MLATVLLLIVVAAVCADQAAAYSGYHRHKHVDHSKRGALRGVYHPSLLETQIKEGQFTQTVLKEMLTDGRARRIVAFADLVDSDVSRVESFVMDVKAALHSASTVLSRALEPLATKKAEKSVAKVALEKPAAKPSPKHENATQNATSGSPTAKHVGGVKTLPANIKAALAKEQTLLAGLLSHLKSNIMHFNKQEKKGKTEEDALLKKAQERLAKDQTLLKNSTKMSAFQHAMLVNQTKMEEQEVKYWGQGRQASHSMFHANLKMTHGLMSRVKTVIEAYETAMTKGKLDFKTMTQVKELSLPKAFLEMRHDLRSEASEYIRHLKVSAQLLSDL